jgi:hypothetical protein
VQGGENTNEKEGREVKCSETKRMRGNFLF